MPGNHVVFTRKELIARAKWMRANPTEAEKRPYVVGDSLQIATVMSATGSFDHRAIPGADGAALMKRFKELVESPLGMIASVTPW